MAAATAIRLKPLGDRVLVKPSRRKMRSAAGLIIPDTAKEKPQEGEIVAPGKAIGDDGKLIPMDVKCRRQDLYGNTRERKSNSKARNSLIMHQDDILGSLNNYL